MPLSNPHIGSSLDDLLAQDGTLDRANARAVKRVLAWQFQQEMERSGISKTVMSERMKTSRAALDRLLDPGNGSVTLATLERAATAIGKVLRVELVDRDPSGMAPPFAP
ncbi:MAG: Fis family transcriptional regulator [Rhodospirillaceae bacterium]